MKTIIDGTGNDTTAEVADAVRKGGKVVLTGKHIIGNISVEYVENLDIEGPGEVLRSEGAPSIFTFSGCSNISIRGLNFDFNALDQYNGIKFYSCENVTLEKNFLVNSNAPPVADKDRYGFVFGRGSRPSRNIRVENNWMDGLQLEIDHVDDAVVRRNTILNSVQTGAIGCFTIQDYTQCQRVRIIENIIGDPVASAIAFCIDAPDNNYARFVDIEVIGNTILRTENNLRAGQHGIVFGTANVQQATMGNVFRAIKVNNNRFIVAEGSQVPGAFVRFMASGKSNFFFDDVLCQDNDADNGLGTNLDSYALDFRFLRAGRILRNEIEPATHGLALVDGLATIVSHNNVSGIITNDYSHGFNVFSDNFGISVGREQPNSRDLML